MTTMNIKDPQVHAMAKTLAGRRHTTVTGAVREALQEALDRDCQARSGIADRLLELGRRARALDSLILTDDDMYDEQGLPK